MTQLWTVRHGATEWSSTGRHTGRTDLPLSGPGEIAAQGLAPRLSAVQFDAVLTSPRQRARRTAELAGFPRARIEPLAVEWDYGDYEGRTRTQIQGQVPNWTPWTYPAMPGGETLDAVASRADTLLAALNGERVLLFAHAHFLRVLAARYLGQPPGLAAHLALDPASVSVLDLDRGMPIIDRWNS